MVVRLFAVLVCLACIGVVVGLAAEGTVVSYEKGKLTVNINGKDEVIKLGKGTKLIGKDGKGIKGKEAADVLKKDVKVEVTKEGDKTEVRVK
jgi:hypothetical protein